jgi:hypothetical protein
MDFAHIDQGHKCDKPGLPSCYNLGYKGGLIDGQQHKLNRAGYSAKAGCGSVGASASPNYCNGYVLGYNKAYGHFSNNTEIWVT